MKERAPINSDNMLDAEQFAAMINDAYRRRGIELSSPWTALDILCVQDNGKIGTRGTPDETSRFHIGDFRKMIVEGYLPTELMPSLRRPRKK